MIAKVSPSLGGWRLQQTVDVLEEDKRGRFRSSDR
jgi:hypothetical protein